MALATQCPHCGTMFRVAADQLKLRGGIVRCGACTQIFDGSAALVDLASVEPVSPPAASPSLPPEPAPAAQPEAAAPAAADTQDAEEAPIFTLEFDRTFSPFGNIPQVSEADAGARADDVLVAERPDAAPAPEAAPEPEPEPEPEPAPESVPAPAPAPEAAAMAPPEAAPDAPPDAPASPVLALPVDEELVAAPLPDDGPEPASAAPARSPRKAGPASGSVPHLLLRESGPATVTMPVAPSAPQVAPRTPRTRAAEARAARRSKLTPTEIGAPRLRVPENDEPEFVRRGRQRERSGRAVRIALVVGTVLLVLALAAQAVSTFRNTLAARYPDMKPSLVTVCALLGCRVELPAQIDQLAIETGELTTLGGNAYTFTTLLRNGGDLVQAWPSLELTLSDADDKPLVRRVFGPRDYLPAGQPAAAGFAAHTEQAVKLHFRVEEPAPSGYHIAVFYP